MNTRTLLLYLLLPLALWPASGCTNQSLEEEVSNENTSVVAHEAAQGPIRWMTFDEMTEAQKKEPRKVVVDVYTDWCGWCKKMDVTTFRDTNVARYLSEKFYAVKLNAEHTTPLLYKGKTLTASQLAGQIFGVSGYPTTVYLDEKSDLLAPRPGFLSVPEFLTLLHYFGENHYQKIAFREFEKTFKP